MMTSKTREYWRFATVYAFRSLWRNRRRTLLTAATIAFAVAMSMFTSRVADSLLGIWRDGSADTGTAHAQIHAKGYTAQPEGVSEELSLKDGWEGESRLAADPEVGVFGKRLKFEGLVSTDDRSLYFVGIGVDPATERQISPRLFDPATDVGRFVVADDIQGVTVGKGMAEALGLKLGSEMTLVAQTAQGSVNAVDVVVRGIVDVPLPNFSKRMLFMNLEHARRLLRLPGYYTEIAVRLKNGSNSDAWVARQQTSGTLGQAEIRGWWDIEPYIRSVERIFRSVVGLISSLLFLSAAVAVLNIILVMVTERTVEIGTLMAIGARERDIRAFFVLESVFLGIVGGLGGVAGGVVAVTAAAHWGIRVNSPFGETAIVAHPTLTAWGPGALMVASILICWLAAYFPARKAARLDPLRAFRGQDR